MLLRECSYHTFDYFSVCVLMVLIQQYAVRELTLCHRSSRARMVLCACGVGSMIRYLYSLLLCRPEGMLLCT